tara:strand:- start:1644 stop:2807 length:1164 start_codon:yes stop_codon:yes gene_type:complete
MKKKDWPNFNNNLITKVVNVIKSGKINYTSGLYGTEFERKFSKFVGNKYSIALCNGTAALEVAIKSLNFPKRSRIIVPARSFFSSASCIVNTGHIPVFVDIDPITQNISIEDLKKKINNSIKAIICVHLGGLPCDMKNIKNLAKTRKIKIIEDCSQAHGASINNKQVGSFGEIATWSFCTDKIISTLGEGGMISTNNKKIFEYCKRYINHGTALFKKKSSEKFIYNKDIFGTNLRITEMQSVAGIEQLKNIKITQKKREEIAKGYFKILSIYKDYLRCYMPKKNIKNAWYRFYFFLNPQVKNYQKLRFKMIKLLKDNNIKCFTGACPEIYLEKSFKNLKNIKFKRLKNCKLLGDISIALDVNHTLSNYENYKNQLKLKKSLKKIFGN